MSTSPALLSVGGGAVCAIMHNDAQLKRLRGCVYWLSLRAVLRDSPGGVGVVSTCEAVQGIQARRAVLVSIVGGAASGGEGLHLYGYHQRGRDHEGVP